MSISITSLGIYLLGGFTFLPGLFLVVLLHLYLTLPARSPSSSDGAAWGIFDSQDDGRSLQSAANVKNLAEKFHQRHEADVAAGYFAVCREYVPGGVNGKPPERTTPAGAVVAAESPSVYQSMYRSIFDRKQGPSLDPGKGNGKAVKRARNVFYVVLRHGHLMLYEDSEQAEVKHVISLELHDVGIYCGGDQIPEGELWIKRNAIRLARKQSIDDPTSISKPFFFFSENCSDKEDFYFALLQNQEIKPDARDNPPRPQQYETKHIISLVQKLHSSEEFLQTRWINGLVGRLFLALYKTQAMEEFIRRKITKKIARVKKPAFLTDIILQKIDMGESGPFLTNPRLKDLTVDGDCCVEADLRYSGNFRLEIAATARIVLGARFKAREVNLVLAVVVKKLDGHALVKFKPPPSNRIWLSFETMPDMEMSIEPIVSSRQITYGIILRAIESRIREVMAETVVLPHWDDSPFINTVNQHYRGGIWAERPHSTHVQPEHTRIPDEAPEDEADLEVDSAPVTHAPSRIDDESTVHMPVLPEASTSVPMSRSNGSSTKPITDVSKEGFSSGAQKHGEPPKALRSRSFASAANPLLSMDNANVESTHTEPKRKTQQDATSAIKAISSRSRPTSPSDTGGGLAVDNTTLCENSKQPSSGSSMTSESSEQKEQNPRGGLIDSPGREFVPPTLPHGIPRSSKVPLDEGSLQSRVMQANNESPTVPEKKQSIVNLGAATAAAKTWGWGVLNRNITPRAPSNINHDHTFTPSQPMGRGRPLPPPGQPLPFPEGTRLRTSAASSPKRKPVVQPALSPKRQGDVEDRTPLPLPLSNRRRQGGAPLKHHEDEGLLIVQAPPDSEPPNPKHGSIEETVKYIDPKSDKGSTSSSNMHPSIALASHGQSNSGEQGSRQVNSSHEDDNIMLAWSTAQKEESRSKSLWLGTEEQA